MDNKNEITSSQVADGKSKIIKSKNTSKSNLNKVRKETILISFVVSVLSAILATYIYEKFLK